MNFCKVANQPGDRVYPNEQRRNSCGLADVCPLTKQQQRREKYSTSSSGQTGKKSKTRACTNCHRPRRGDRLRRGASTKKQHRCGKKQHNAYQNSENRSRRLQITADVCGRNGKKREWPK